MKGEIRVVSVPKNGNDANENMDACWPPGHTEVDAPVLRLAMADGVSQTLLAGRWAQWIVRELGCADLRAVCSGAEFIEVLALRVAAWPAEMRAYLDERKAHGRPIQFYEKRKLAQGPAATVLAVYLWDDADGAGRRWAAAALGDTCVFQVGSDGHLRAAFPLGTSRAFSSTTDVIRGFDVDWAEVAASVKCHSGTFEPGDTFYLGTDAISAWILREKELGRSPWTELTGIFGSLGAQARFAKWVDERRATGAMRNDDVSLIRLELR